MPLTDALSVQAQNTAAVLPTTYAALSSSVAVAVPQPSLSVLLSSTVSDPTRQNAAAAGDLITYGYTVTNNGNVQMDSIAVADTKGDTVTCPHPTLAIGDSMTCTASPGYTVVQADVDAGVAVTNVATVTTVPAGGGSTVTFTSPAGGVQVAAAVPALRITVAASTAGPVRLGDTIGYDYTVDNLGNVKLDNLGVTDAKAATVTCPATVLPAGATMGCHSSSTSYTVGQADIDAGVPIRNDAIVDALSVAPGHMPASAESNAPVPVVAAAPALTLTSIPHVTPAGHAAAAQTGDQVYFTYQVHNGGNVTMHGVAITDTLTGPGTCPNVPLPVNTTMSCTGGPSYIVTQDDYDAAAPLSGTARVQARAPGVPVPGTYDTATAGVPVGSGNAAAALATAALRVLPAGHQAAVEAGDRFAVDFTVRNTGTLTMRNITVSDDRAGTATCPGTSLRPAASMTCTTPTYTVLQSDIDRGEPLTSVATLRGQAGTGAVQTYGTAGTWLAVTRGVPSLDVRVVGTVSPAAHRDAAGVGDGLTWTFQVVNNGNQTFTAIAATGTGTITCPQDRLTVRETMTCTSDRGHTVTQEEVDAGKALGAVVTVTGTAPDGPHRFGPVDGTVAVVAADPRLEIAMTTRVTAQADMVEAEEVDTGVTAGDLLRYTYKVYNRGNVTVGSLSVVHARAPKISCATGSSPPAPVPTAWPPTCTG